MFDVADTLVEPPGIDPVDLVDELDVVLDRITRLEARAARLAALVSETRAFDRDGFSSTTSLLKYRGRRHPGEAHRLVTRGNALRDCPVLSCAYESGLVTSAQVDVLLYARFLAPQAFTGAEAFLVDLAENTPLVSELRRRVDYWAQSVAPGEVEAERQLVRDLQGVRIRRDQEMIRMEAWYPLLEGERLLSALDPGPPAGDDDRPLPARRAQRLLELVAGRAKPAHLVVHVDLDTLASGVPGLTETEAGTVLTGDELARLACDPQVTRVVFGPQSRPLDVGRTKRLVTPALKLAVVARDRHCRFPNCEQNPSRCDVHHIVSWSRGGETKLTNLVLLCAYHHMLVHEGGWTLTGIPGRLEATRPDQTRLHPQTPVPDPWYRPPPQPGLPPGGLWPLIQKLPRLRSHPPP